MFTSIEQIESSVSDGGAGARAVGGLDSNTSFVDQKLVDEAYESLEKQHELRSEPRRRLWAEQRSAAYLLKGKKQGRVSKCLKSLAYGKDGVNVEIYDERARFGNLMTCGNVWTCPICSRNISRIRAREANKALAWARAKDSEGFINATPMMMTLTARHGRKDDLAVLVNGLLEAKRMMFQSKKWRKIKPRIAGFLIAFEITHGKNGWHPHFHIIFFVKTSSSKEAAKLLSMKALWLRCLRSQGLSGNGHGFDLAEGDKVGNYISKFGAADGFRTSDAVKRISDAKRAGNWDLASEITAQHRKKSTRKLGSGRNPWELLEDYTHEGDNQAGALFIEFAEVFHGKQQLQWSRGLKQLVGVDEITNEDAADADVEFLGELDRIGITISPRDWYELLKKTTRIQRLEILETAELTDDDEMVWLKVEELLGRDADRELDNYRQIKERREISYQHS
ncbi:protein rep [Ruegeria arenilitoris]|uniref:protein rep n=1 Tax=Ruegeria arenilitoris TaxID=1173585 RepID=UPI00147A3A08|nr:protein rep [Ruegeria arenilitoris]